MIGWSKAKSRAAAWFLMGGLTVACFGGPLAGAVSGLFWSNIGGGWTESAAYRRIHAAIYVRHHEEGDLGTSGIFEIFGCQPEMELREYDRDGSNLNRPVQVLNSSLRRYQSFLKSAIGDQVGIEAMRKLPYPVLGALEQCISKSLLADLCEAEVERIERVARKSAAQQIAKLKSARDDEMKQVWCAVNGVYKRAGIIGANLPD